MIYDEPMLPDWSRYHPQDFEALVTRLLRRIHPTGYRPDGTGGDGGRDFVVPSATGNLIYQVKHYTGRMTSSRR